MRSRKGSLNAARRSERAVVVVERFKASSVYADEWYKASEAWSTTRNGLCHPNYRTTPTRVAIRRRRTLCLVPSAYCLMPSAYCPTALSIPSLSIFTIPIIACIAFPAFPAFTPSSPLTRSISTFGSICHDTPK